MEEGKTFKNFAFISYSHVDKKAAEELQKVLDDFHLSDALKEKYPDRPEVLREIFRDDTGLPAGSNLTKEIQKQLEQSNYLIVICSPNAAKSEWVNNEIDYFKTHREPTHIIPFIIDGVANAKSADEQECFPDALKSLEARGANISTFSFERAVIEVIAGALEIDVDDLWQRHVRAEEAKKRQLQEQRDNLLRVQSRFLAEKANTLSDKDDFRVASLLALEALPDNLKNPNRPYTEEAGIALRKATENENPIIEGRNCYFCGNGENIIYASDLAIKICSSTTGMPIQSWIGNDEGTDRIVLSPDQKLIASISKDRNINIWDLDKRKCVKSAIYTDKHLYRVQFSSDNQYVVYLLENPLIERYDLVIWDIFSDKSERISFSDSFNFSISHDSKRIMVFSSDSVTLWNLKNGKLITNYGENDCRCGYYSPFGNYLAIERKNHTISVLNSETMQVVNTLSGHSISITSIAFNRNNKQIVSTSKDKTIRIWNVDKGECERTYTFSDIIYNASFSPDGKRILFEKEISFIDTIEGISKNEIRLFDIKPANEPIILDSGSDSVLSANFSPNSELAVSSYSNGLIKIWDTNNGECVKVISAHAGHHVRTVCFSHSGDSIVSASSDETIVIWYYKENNRHVILKGHKDHVTSAFFDINDERIISTSVDSTIRIWDKTGRCMQILHSDDYDIDIAAISPNGKIIASNAHQGGEYYILIWNIENGSIIRTLSGHQGEITSIAFNSKGDSIVTGSGINDYSIRIWNIESGVCKKILKGHYDIVSSVAFSNDDSQIISASWDNTIKIWEDDRVETISGHTKGVNSAFFSKDGKRIISASEDHAVKIWNYQSLQKLIDRTTERFKGCPLTKIERKKYYLN